MRNSARVLKPEHLELPMCSLLSLTIDPNKLRLTGSRGAISRPRLRELFSIGEPSKLTLVCAGAGFGKTTALADYLNGTTSPTARYRLDWADNDLARFLTHLVETVRSVYPDFGRGIKGSIRRLAQMPSGRVALADLLGNQLAALDRPLVLALDDYQILHSMGDVTGIIGHLLEFPAPQLRLIIATRTLPNLPIARLRVRGDLHMITASELAFTLPETEALMSSHGAFDQGSAVRAIHEQTEGWPAGVGMLLQVLRHRGLDSLPDLVKDSRLRDSGIDEYLADEVLKAQPPHVRAFLLKTSILRQLQVDLCDELLESDDSRQLFDYLKEHDLFTHSVASEPPTYRYHEIFRSFLEFMLAREYPYGEVANLHVRAAHCYERRSSPDEAIRHFIAGRRLDLAVKVIERVAEHYIEMGMLETVEQWFECVVTEDGQPSPRLRGLQALVRARRRGQFLPAIEGLSATRAGFVDVGDREGFVWASTHLSTFYYKTGGYAEGIAALQPVVQGDAALPVGQRAQVLRALCDNYRGMGELELAIAHGREALTCSLEMPDDYRKSQIARALAQSLLHQGNLNEALRIAEFALQLNEGDPERFGDFELASVTCLLGIIHALRGDDAAALSAFDRTETHMGQLAAEHWSCMNTWRGNIERDRNAFTLAQQYYDRVPTQSLAEQSFLRRRQGDSEGAVRLARNALALASERQQVVEGATAELAYGLATFAISAQDESEAALRRSLELFERAGRLQYQLSVWVHLFVVRSQSGDTESALAMLQRAIKLGRELRVYHFPFWDPEAVRLARDRASSLSSDDRAYLHRLRHTLQDRGEGSPTPRPVQPRIGSTASLSECSDAAIQQRLADALSDIFISKQAVPLLRSSFGLTWREIDVLVAYYLRPAKHGLAVGETRRQQCMEELCISENTLKRHVGSIRQKLDMAFTGNPLHLLQWARAQGLIA